MRSLIAKRKRTHVKKILPISVLIAIIFSGYFIYQAYKKSIEIKSYIAIAEERAFLFSLLVLDKKKNTNHLEKYIKSLTKFDLRVMRKYNDIKNKINLKRYCSNLQNIQSDTNDSNQSIKNIFYEVCPLAPTLHVGSPHTSQNTLK